MEASSWCMVLIIVSVSALGAAMIMSYHGDPPLPSGCGLTDINSSETIPHTSLIMVGKVLTSVSDPYEFKDLACVNGTFVPKWRRV